MFKDELIDRTKAARKYIKNFAISKIVKELKNEMIHTADNGKNFGFFNIKNDKLETIFILENKNKLYTYKWLFEQIIETHEFEFIYLALNENKGEYQLTFRWTID
jgi:hypothetical protein